MEGKEIIEQTLQDYLIAIEEVKTAKNLTDKERLRKLLPPLIKLNKAINESDKVFAEKIGLSIGTDEKCHKFANETYIDLDEELDMENLEYKKTSRGYTSKGTLRWSIVFDMVLDRKYDNMPTYSKIIQISDKHPLYARLKKPGGEKSIKELYEYWLPTLTKESIKSIDLLDQMLVWYTIKMAQNVDNNAIDKLYNLYKDRAEDNQTYDRTISLIYSKLYNEPKKDDDHDNDQDDKATNEEKELTKKEEYIAVDQKIKRKSIDDDESLNYYDSDEKETQHYQKYGRRLKPLIDKEDFKSTSSIWLRLIVSGFSPKSILDSLLKDDSCPRFRLPSIVQDIYITYLLVCVPQAIDLYLNFLHKAHKYLKDIYSEENIIELFESIKHLLNYFTISNDDDVVNSYRALRESFGCLESRDLEALFMGVIMPLVLKAPSAVAPYFAILLNPYTPVSDNISIIRQTEAHKTMNILGFCYRPQKMGPKSNLTTWLFGSNSKTYRWGTLYQMLQSEYLPEVMGNPARHVSFDEEQDSPNDDSAEERRINLDCLEKIAERCNISDSDVSLLRDTSEYTQDELAGMYGLTKDQVRYKIKTLSEKMQQNAKNL